MNKLSHATGANTLSPEQFIANLASTPECFHITGGIFAGAGETVDVQIADYHAPIAELVADNDYRRHYIASLERPRIWLPLEIGPDFRFGFDIGDDWFRIGKRALLHVAERHIPVGIVSIDIARDNSDLWLYYDPRDGSR